MVPQEGGLEAWPPVALLPAEIGLGLGLVGQVGVRGAMIGVAVQLP